jgi:hypothetical protein
MAAPRRWRAVSLADVDFKTIAVLVNSRFVTRDPNGDSHSLELIQAESASGGDGVARAEGSESFSLLFRGDATRPLDQNTYSFVHERIGRFEMFIVPIGRECDAQCQYEAVFNRPPPESRQPGRFVTLRRNW